MKLQVIFISDLLEHKSNRVKENYLKGKRDRFSLIMFLWLSIVTDRKVSTIWQSFLLLITNQEDLLLSPINTSIQKSAHIISNTKILANRKYLRIQKKNQTSHFELK